MSPDHRDTNMRQQAESIEKDWLRDSRIDVSEWLRERCFQRQVSPGIVQAALGMINALPDRFFSPISRIYYAVACVRLAVKFLEDTASGYGDMVFKVDFPPHHRVMQLMRKARGAGDPKKRKKVPKNRKHTDSSYVMCDVTWYCLECEVMRALDWSVWRFFPGNNIPSLLTPGRSQRVPLQLQEEFQQKQQQRGRGHPTTHYGQKHSQKSQENQGDSFQHDSSIAGRVLSSETLRRVKRSKPSTPSPAPVRQSIQVMPEAIHTPSPLAFVRPLESTLLSLQTKPSTRWTRRAAAPDDTWMVPVGRRVAAF